MKLACSETTASGARRFASSGQRRRANRARDERAHAAVGYRHPRGSLRGAPRPPEDCFCEQRGPLPPAGEPPPPTVAGASGGDPPLRVWAPAKASKSHTPPLGGKFPPPPPPGVKNPKKEKALLKACKNPPQEVNPETERAPMRRGPLGKRGGPQCGRGLSNLLRLSSETSERAGRRPAPSFRAKAGRGRCRKPQYSSRCPGLTASFPAALGVEAAGLWACRFALLAIGPRLSLRARAGPSGRSRPGGRPGGDPGRSREALDSRLAPRGCG